MLITAIEQIPIIVEKIFDKKYLATEPMPPPKKTSRQLFLTNYIVNY